MTSSKIKSRLPNYVWLWPKLIRYACQIHFWKQSLRKTLQKISLYFPKGWVIIIFSHFPCGQIFKLVEINSRTLSIDHSLTEKVSNISIDQYLATLKYVLEQVLDIWWILFCWEKHYFQKLCRHNEGICSFHAKTYISKFKYFFRLT